MLDKPVGNLPRSVFVLTDGQISDRQRVCDYIRKSCNTTRVHSFGIGSGADSFLVKEMAKAGKGRSYMIEDNDNSIQSKVIEALKHASAPAFTNIVVDWGVPQGTVLFQTPDSKHMEICFEGEPLTVQAIIKKEALASCSGKASISLYNTSASKECQMTVDFDKDSLKENGYGFQLAAKKMIDRSEALQIDNKAEQIANSVKYQVLCKHTSMFGQIKNKEKSDGEMETVKIPVTLEPWVNTGRAYNSGGLRKKKSKKEKSI